MTAYTIQQLEALAATTGEGDRNVPVRSQTRNVPTLNFRVDVRRDIYSFVIQAAKPVTRAEIAKAVGRKKTTWFNERIEACVADGLLTRSQNYWRNGVVMYFYSAADGGEG